MKKVADNFIVARTKCIEVYRVPIWSTEEQRYTRNGYIVSALAMDSGPAREAAIVVRPSIEEPEASSSTALPPLPPVTVLLAQYSYTLMQIDLIAMRTNKEGTSTVPYDMPRSPTRVFQIAPSSCQLKVSSGGKGIWMQTHNIVNRHAKYPARCIMGFDICTATQDFAPYTLKPNHCELSLMMNKDDVPGASDVHICQSQLYSRRCDMSEILRRKYCVVTAALEDSVGRIAVGDRQGRIEVLDYA